MIDRGFTEVDLRRMIEDAFEAVPAWEDGRWVVLTRLDQRQWNVVVEPDAVTQTLVVITAYQP